MELLNEQTIKRLQKLAGINEIKVNTPSPEDPDLKALIENLVTKEGNAEESIDTLYYKVFWFYENDMSASRDINSTADINTRFDELLEFMAEDGMEINDYVIKWIEAFKALPKNAYYIFNPDKYVSCKFTKIDNNTLSSSLPNHWSEEFPTMKWDSSGKLVPNN